VTWISFRFRDNHTAVESGNGGLLKKLMVGTTKFSNFLRRASRRGLLYDAFFPIFRPRKIIFLGLQAGPGSPVSPETDAFLSTMTILSSRKIPPARRWHCAV
jgi:hypothetical protein